MIVAQLWQQESLDHFIEDLLDRLEISLPPIDPLTIVQRLGVQVQRNRDQMERGRLRKRDRNAIIVVRPEPRWERTCWTLAHELGEFLMPGLLDWLERNDAEAVEREWLANEFASRLLVPTRWLIRDGVAAPFDLEQLKNQYSTASYEVIALQLLSIGRPLIVSVFDDGRLTRRQGNLPIRPPRPFPFEREAQRQVMLTSRPHEIRHDVVTAHAWPVHEPDWKREIVLTTFDDSVEWESY